MQLLAPPGASASLDVRAALKILYFLVQTTRDMTASYDEPIGPRGALAPYERLPGQP